MKTIFKFPCQLAIVISTAFLVLHPCAVAQDEQPEVGFLRIVNAVAPGEGNANILVDGKDLYPKGYKLGQKTAGFGIKAGEHTVTIKKVGVESGTTKVKLNKGETLSMIGFAEKIEPIEEGEPAKWRTRILLLKQSDPESGYRLALVPLCGDDELKVEIQVAGRPQPDISYAKRMVVTPVGLGKSKPEVNIKVDGESVATIAPEDPGNYVVVFYEDEAGKVKALTFYDPKFVIAG